MISYYTMIILLSLMALGILCILVRENGRLPAKDKHMFYLTYGLIALSAVAEWLGIQMNGQADMPRWSLLVIKCCDYILTPFAGGIFIGQMRIRNIWSRILVFVLMVNTVFQVISVFTGWMVTLDDQNRYAHGPLYIWYVAVYVIVIIIIMIQFMIYGKSFRRQNRISLYSIVFLVVAGIIIQELFGAEFRTAYLALTFGAILLFIHITEFAQLASDEYIEKQQVAITTDVLTGVLSRYAYTERLKDLAVTGIPGDFVAFSIDINELKSVNDTLGHEAGDELICGAATCIRKAMGADGDCYRTGGDEFVVLARMSRDDVDGAMNRLGHELDSWTGEKVKGLRLAVGYALAEDHVSLSVEKLIEEADFAMYDAKAAYYQAMGIERRRH